MTKKDLDATVNELLHAAGLLVRRVRAAAEDELSLTEASVLKRLDTEGPATTAELARAESVKPQSMGATVASLEEDGLIERRPHPTDGRQMHILITAKGSTLRATRRAAKRSWLTQAISRLDKKEQESLSEAVSILKHLAEQ